MRRLKKTSNAKVERLAFIVPIFGLFSGSAGCGGQSELAVSKASLPAAAAIPAPQASASLPLTAAASTESPKITPEPSVSPCPDGMAYVDTTYCPEVKLNCVKSSNNVVNHIMICHEFEGAQQCVGEERRQRFCIDKYEYPNQAGAHPPVMVSWYDAAGMCEAQGKRLCWESEWVSACEGPEKLPFPYGMKRDPAKCNIDNGWLNVDLKKVYSKFPHIQHPELIRLDQSVPSGHKEDCKSGFGVHDLTGNLDEWVNAEQTHEKSKWAGLKGGAWGHVRNACRPMTTSHAPDFTYYFVSFRCCADAAPDAEAAKDPKMWTPPAQPKPEPPPQGLQRGWAPSEKGPNQPY